MQIRLSHGLTKQLDAMVKTGVYSSRSDVIRDAVRRLTFANLVGIIPDTGDSVKEVREIRKQLSKRLKSFRDIEKLNKLLE